MILGASWVAGAESAKPQGNGVDALGHRRLCPSHPSVFPPRTMQGYLERRAGNDLGEREQEDLQSVKVIGNINSENNDP